jgi:hypothetical protein
MATQLQRPPLISSVLPACAANAVSDRNDSETASWIIVPFA